ncbi:excalibur calcium-binding domain-containing protein [Vibrio sp. RW]|uniref:excalibur calcium-binding domain-containing protein n=1 Tax=Vibrio sp. RW TaxID=2998833 RepID=UPI0022CD2035|nr:excalibur calcium-binding domain-containing protein [Vibrio sp. RW]MDA0146175.1 excalibur calcium-binding domain-containing protein [Vibrio sp. RW]
MKSHLLMLFVTLVSGKVLAEEWRGLTVEPEFRCSPYDKKEQYPYSQSVEDDIVASMGGVVYGPYTGTYFENDRATDIEHIVSTSEAHDSGLCKATPEKRAAIAQDLLNLTLAAPKVNRCNIGGKCGYDAAEWLPERNKCWFAARVVLVKQKYGLSVDRAEATRLESIISNCDNFEMQFNDASQVTAVDQSPPVTTQVDALTLYDDNNNGRITCSEARAHGIAPVRRGDIAYEFMRDPDQDGVVCE